MRIAVTAASGRLGRAILHHLRELHPAGSTIAVVRDPSRQEVSGVETRTGDYGSISQMRAALQGAGTVVMIASPVVAGIDRARLHRNVIEAARESDVSRLIFTSLIGNGREMETLFGATQQVNRQTEADVRESGLGWVIGRNALYLDLDLAHVRRAAGSGVYASPGGEGRCAYLSIDEIACAYARLASDPGQSAKTYNITGQTCTQAELVALANEAFGLQVRYEVIGDDAYMANFLRQAPGRGEAVARMLTGAFQSIRAGAFDVPSDFRAAAGRPARSLREMMRDLATGPRAN